MSDETEQSFQGILSQQAQSQEHIHDMVETFTEILMSAVKPFFGKTVTLNACERKFKFAPWISDEYKQLKYDFFSSLDNFMKMPSKEHCMEMT